MHAFNLEYPNKPPLTNSKQNVIQNMDGFVLFPYLNVFSI